MRRYWLTLACTLTVLCLGTAGFCLVVDPYNQQSMFARPDLAPHKFFGDTRTAKALNLYRHDYDAIILGSSRTEIGLNPVDPIWQSQRVYNAALAGSNLYETKRVFDYVLHTQKPKLILLGLDFSLFSDNRRTSSDFALSRFDQHTGVSAFFKENLSKPAIEKALRTVRYNREGQPTSDRFGQRLSDDSFSEKIQRVGQYTFIFRTLNTKVITNREAYAQGAYSQSRMAFLSDMLRASAENEIKLILFISPIHALQLAAIHELGLWPEFESWKRDLVRALRGYPDVALFDFSNWNHYLQEPVPKYGSPDTMQWYWETSHYKEALGQKLLIEMLSGKDDLVDHIASRLDQVEIETELRAQRTSLGQYLHEHPEELAHIRCLIAQTCSVKSPPETTVSH